MRSWTKHKTVSETSISKSHGSQPGPCCRLACVPDSSAQLKHCGAPGIVSKTCLFHLWQTLDFSKNARRENCGGNYWQNCITALILLILNWTFIKDQASYVKDCIVLVKNIPPQITKPAINSSKKKSLPVVRVFICQTVVFLEENLLVFLCLYSVIQDISLSLVFSMSPYYEHH